jgi:RNA polymerase sigma factor (sigma-70 family)
MISDPELLARFARTNSEEAFAELVNRHVNLVYSVARRQVSGDDHLAQDVAQTVFTDLARKAGSLAQRENLTGWLYTSAYFAAAKIVRAENRRRDREEQFMREPAHTSAPDAEWEKIRPALDAAMHELKAADREAILLRYFENRPFAEVGHRLGLNENAATKRVERALEKLRAIFTKRGLTTVTALASVISTNAVQTAPESLAPTLTTTSLAMVGTGTFSLLKIMTATKIKLAFSAILVASAATALVVQHQAQQTLRDENGSLQQQVARLQTDNVSLSNRLVTVGEAKKLTDDQLNELMKLRGEVGVLRRQVGELGKLRQPNRQMNAATNSEAQQKAMRSMTKMNDARVYCAAIQQYILEHGGETPDNLDQLHPYMGNSHVSGTNEFEIIHQGKITDASYPEIVIVLRDKEVQAVQSFGNNRKMWGRLYGFADGNVQLITSEDGNFDAFEQKHIFLPPPNQ